MIGLWLVGLLRRDVSIVDPFWGIGFILVAFVAFACSTQATARSCLVLGLTIVWGLRLSLFLFWRNWGHGEDRRYAAMRAAHGSRFWWVSLLTVFLLQAAILWFVSLPIQFTITAEQPASLGWLDLAGAFLWAVGLMFEALGDWQLLRFKARPENAGRVLDRGLWRYTRHPNYFGDFCVWWGLYAIAIAAGGFWTFASPLLMSGLLLWVSGVRLLESTIVDRRPDYLAYRAQTSAFFPWRRRRPPDAR